MLLFCKATFNSVTQSRGISFMVALVKENATNNGANASDIGLCGYNPNTCKNDLRGYARLGPLDLVHETD